MSDRNIQRTALLREGLLSYLDAVTAIDEFTRMIQEDCRSVLERQVNSLEKATSLRFSLKGITEYSEPYKYRPKLWSGQYAWIGVELPVTNSAKLHSMDVGLAWNYEKGERSTNFYSSFYTKQLSGLDELNARLRRPSDTQFEVDKTLYGLILWDENVVGSAGSYQLDRLERLLIQWIAVWKLAGGVTKKFANGRNKK